MTIAVLPNWVAGALRPSMLLTWYRDGTTTAEDLTGATLTGTITKLFGDGATRAIAGTLTVTDAAGGVFRWDFDAADVVEGVYLVQFNAAFGSGPTPAIPFEARWQVLRRHVVA